MVLRDRARRPGRQLGLCVVAGLVGAGGTVRRRRWPPRPCSTGSSCRMARRSSVMVTSRAWPIASCSRFRSVDSTPVAGAAPGQHRGVLGRLGAHGPVRASDPRASLCRHPGRGRLRCAEHRGRTRPSRRGDDEGSCPPARRSPPRPAAGWGRGPRITTAIAPSDVAQLTGLLDDAVGELRVAAGLPRLDLTLVATASPLPPMVPELAPPTLRESIEQAFTAAIGHR